YTSQSDTSPQKLEPQNHQIVSQAFSLKAGEFMSYKFTIPKNSGSGTVSGNFVATGGSNDIYVVVTNEAGVTNIKSGNNYKSYYNSGKVTTDNLNISLSPGTYYIVFSNIHSMMTPKAVNADINVVY
ncbi:MAG: emp24/gp25L/p24 family protein, partial [Acidobacteriota bacterium]